MCWSKQYSFNLVRHPEKWKNEGNSNPGPRPRIQTFTRSRPLGYVQNNSKTRQNGHHLVQYSFYRKSKIRLWISGIRIVTSKSRLQFTSRISGIQWSRCPRIKCKWGRALRPKQEDWINKNEKAERTMIRCWKKDEWLPVKLGRILRPGIPIQKKFKICLFFGVEYQGKARVIGSGLRFGICANTNMVKWKN